MRQDLLGHFDRITRQAWLPIGAALVISATAYGAYSTFIIGADSRATSTTAREVEVAPAAPAKASGMDTAARDGDGAPGGSLSPAVALGTSARPEGGIREQPLP